MKKYHKYISKTLIAIGAILLLGTAGASDAATISFTQIFIQALISLGLIVTGLRIGGVVNAKN